MNKRKIFSVGKIALLGMYTAMALIIFVIESAIPLPVPLPFMKLGLANVVTLIVLVQYSPKDAGIVLGLRILLSTIFSGQIVYLLYSIAGGLFCFAAECLINFLLQGRYITVTSIFGAIFHNLGQLLMAVFLMGRGVIPYLPYMIIMGIVTGLFTGILAEALVIRLRRVETTIKKERKG